MRTGGLPERSEAGELFESPKPRKKTEGPGGAFPWPTDNEYGPNATQMEALASDRWGFSARAKSFREGIQYSKAAGSGNRRLCLVAQERCRWPQRQRRRWGSRTGGARLGPTRASIARAGSRTMRPFERNYSRLIELSTCYVRIYVLLSRDGLSCAELRVDKNLG
jgi:hypothetical protein